ncbi:endosialin-like [Betta splendens]|uniref:Endosialin-like n=1 Tax=Betta splendens TaxID=158456 RepID=A0A6P7PHM3_BETSP|nr:endosialin-like [Betta splendens]
MCRWMMQKTGSSSSSWSSSWSSMGLLCVLLLVCLTPASRAQRLRETEADQGAARAQLEERHTVCHEEGCYTVFLQKRTFREAGRSCREQSGTLATMHTHEAAGVVHQLLSAIKAQGTKSRFRLWIGLHRPPRQCSSNRPLRGFVWVTGDQDGQFTNWLREDAPGTCAVPRCVATTVHTSESGRESSDNFRWLDGACALSLDGYVCQYNYRGMCPPLKDEDGRPAVYTTPFHLVSTVLTHVPYGSIATLSCPAGGSKTVLCTDGHDGTVGWDEDAPLCPSSAPPKSQDWCSEGNRCDHYCQNTDTDYYCYCAEGYTIDEDGYACRPDPLGPTDPPELSSDSAGPTEQPRIRDVCVKMGCEYNCMDTVRGTRCTCPPGYQMAPDGRRCSDVDECRQTPCPQVCVNIPGTFHCTCHPGYQQDDEGECVDIDECLDEASCEGDCENTVGSFACLCDPGYAQNSAGECVDIDECAAESPCDQQCLNLIGRFQCLCDDGYDMQADGVTCMPSPDDEEYSSLTPDPSDSTHSPVMDLDSIIPWLSALTPEPDFAVDVDFDVDVLTEAPERLPPGSDNHLNQWEAQSPKGYQTAPPPTQKYNTGNEINNKAKAGAGGTSGGVGSETANGSATPESPEEVSHTKSKEDFNATEAGSGSAAGKQKHDKSWLLVALLVPLCVFLVVMLALGIVYCTSCAVDKSLSFSDCYRWILPTTPPDRRNGKTQA